MGIPSALEKLHRENETRREREIERERLTDFGGLMKGNEESFICVHGSRGWFSTGATAIKEPASTSIFKEFIFHWRWGINRDS